MEILFLWAGLLFASIGIMIVKSAMFDFAEADRIDGELIGYIANGMGGLISSLLFPRRSRP